MDQPLIFNPAKVADKKVLSKLRAQKTPESDYTDRQIEELFGIRFPRHKDDILKRAKFMQSFPRHTTRWVYFPWEHRLLHLLGPKEYYELRTARNNPLIPRQLQQKLSQLTIGIVGLSVGSNILKALVYAGIGKTFKLADFDTIATSNLNRMSATVLDLEKSKVHTLARQVWAIDPYLHLELYDTGITGANISKFLQSSPKCQLVFDEIDNLVLKVYLRFAARTLRIPYLMVTDNGFNAEIEVFRFDQNRGGGDIEDAPLMSLVEIAKTYDTIEKLTLTPKEEQTLINSLIDGKDRSPEMEYAGRLRQTYQIAGWPQLQAVAGVGAGLAVAALIDLASGKLRAGKKVLSLK